MKTFAFICLLLAIANVVASTFLASMEHNYQPFVHSVGSLIFASMIYMMLDGGDPDVKA